jgi:hypothetical protein
MNAKYYIYYLIKVIALSIILTIVGLILFKIFGITSFFKHLLYLVLLFFTTNIFAHYFLIKFSIVKTNKFIRVFMLVTVIKILTYLSLLITYILIVSSGLIPFLISFFITYICYTSFEVIELSRFLKNGTSK